MLKEYTDVLTTEEACEALRIGYNALYKLLSSGKLKGYRNGRGWRIPKTSIQAYILEPVFTGVERRLAGSFAALPR